MTNLVRLRLPAPASGQGPVPSPAYAGVSATLQPSRGVPATPTLQSMDPPPLKVSLLGGFEIRCGAEKVSIRSGRVRSLLAWLALRWDEPQSRSRVAAALWPESRESQARTNLRNLIHQLRRAFPEVERYLQCDGPALTWRVGAPVSVDVVEFERALSAARSDLAAGADPGAVRRLEDALDRYAGPVLPDGYDPWLTTERDRIRRLHLDALEALLRSRVEDGDHAGARALAERVLGHDPLSEHAHRARITALAALGDRAGASRAFTECESLLASEVGVGPSEATRAAHRAALGTDGAVAGGHGPSGATPVSKRGGEGVLVGRRRERTALLDAHARALATGTRMVWVTGEAGIGKTRLVQAFAEEIEGEGGRVVRARAYPTLGALAYGPVIAWLRSPVLEPALAAASPGTRSELSRLLPERGGPAPTEEGEARTESERRQRLHEAVVGVLSHPDGPSTLILDDLQWGDQETIDLLSSIVVRSARPMLLVATIRTGEMGPEHPLERVGARLAAAGRLERLELEPLALHETGELVRDLLEGEVSDDEVRVLHRETEGNPLFIVETARSGRAWAGGDPWGGRGPMGGGRDALSPRIRAVIEARLGLLSPEGRFVTQVAATIGREFTVPLLLAASPLDEEATLRGLDEAWRRRLVRERDGDWDFSHGKIREVAYRTTSPVRRRTHHERIAGVLERVAAGGAPGPEATLDQIALHHDLGGSVAKAVEWYRRAGRAAMEVSGLDAVRQLLGRALELVERLPRNRSRDEQELEMRLALGSALVALEGYGRPRTVETYERARDLCRRLERPVTSPILRALALASLARGDLGAGTRFGHELSEAAERDSDPVARVEGAYVSGVMAFWKGRLAESERRLADALEGYRPERHRDHVLLYAQDPAVVCLSRLAWTLWHRGRVDEALARRDEALALAERQGDPMGFAYGLWFTLFVAIEQGDVERLASQARALKRIATTHRLLYADTVADGFLGYLDAVRGNAREGIERMRATLADRRWVGMEYVLKLQTLFLVAKAAAGEGDVRTARATVAEALEYIGSAPSIWIAPLLEIDARSVGREDRSGDRALAAFRGALEAARECGSVWTELGVAVERGRWTLARGHPDRAGAASDLERALVPYADAPSLPAVAAGRIILERLTQGGGT